ncbi:MAG: glycoside hydrolase family 127 protein [Spirochaetota bacterium]
MLTGEYSLRPARLDCVRITGGFWESWQRVNREVTIPYVMDKCDETGRTESLALRRDPDSPWDPHPFYDSDVAKSVEAAAYSLHTNPDPELEARVDRYIELFARAQQPDGYLNSYFTLTGLGKRWTNLRDMHELYCAGHLIEAAVAHFRATGKRSLLDIAARYADHIAARLGPEDEPSPDGGTKTAGYPGHEEIEIALVKLADATGGDRFTELARFFISERGSQPHFFRLEAARRGEPEEKRSWDADDFPLPYSYHQAHKPVREQESAEGHSVRACYLYAGMADVARETGDDELMDSCRRLFESVVRRRMYVTGGIGSHMHGERFTYDYDLPNESAYAETCASIALVFFASRMANAELDGRYADAMERALYNGALGGLSLTGDRFFYANPLSYHPTAPFLPHVRSDAERRPWYGCACCPPNIARLIASLGSYLYSTDGDTVAVHLYAESRLEIEIDGARGALVQQTDYPWNGEIAFSYEGEHPATFTLALRIPEWAGSYDLRVEPGHAREARPSPSDARLERGYLSFRRTWHRGDIVRLSLPMEPRRTYAHPAVRQTGWQVALERGPIVYCVEEIDNGPDLAQLALPAEAKLSASYEPDLLGGCTILRAEGVRRDVTTPEAPADAPLYRTSAQRRRSQITAVPFALRTNRGSGEMRVWIAET